jgi:hypothetical protein
MKIDLYSTLADALLGALDRAERNAANPDLNATRDFVNVLSTLDGHWLVADSNIKGGTWSFAVPQPMRLADEQFETVRRILGKLLSTKVRTLNNSLNAEAELRVVCEW